MMCSICLLIFLKSERILGKEISSVSLKHCGIFELSFECLFYFTNIALELLSIGFLQRIVHNKGWINQGRLTIEHVVTCEQRCE